MNAVHAESIAQARKALLVLNASLTTAPDAEVAVVSVLVHDLARQLRMIERVLAEVEPPGPELPELTRDGVTRLAKPSKRRRGEP